MAALPEPQHTTVRAIEQAVEAEAETGFRAHLGASIIGRPCERALWYSFRWATKSAHSGRILRLFARGQREEDVLVDLLRKAGIEVHPADPATDEQFRVSAVGGHFGGSLDGAGVGFVEAPEKWHVLEFKTHNDKSFKQLVKDGVEKAKPEHFAQMQSYMALTGMDRAFYFAVNKNDDQIYAERVRHSAKISDEIIEKAKRIIVSDNPLEKISQDPAWYQCKFCDHHTLCHAKAVPPVSCRTCIHATPELNGQGRWTCGAHGQDLTIEDQSNACPSHAYLPSLLSNWATATDAKGVNIEYLNTLNNQHFLNGPGTDIDTETYTSLELAAATDLAIIGAPAIDEVRREFGGRIAG